MNKIKIVLLLLIPSLLFAQKVSVTDYQVPVSSAKILRFNGGFNWQQTNKEGEVFGRNSNGNANLTLNYFYSSLPFAWFLDIDASGEKINDKYTHDVLISPRIQKYLWMDRVLFGFTKVNLQHKNTYIKFIRIFMRVTDTGVLLMLPLWQKQ